VFYKKRKSERKEEEKESKCIKKAVLNRKSKDLV
jgi:hypothetical protein